MTDLRTHVDIVTDGEYAEHDEVKIVMTLAQADKLAEVLAIVTDDDVIRYDWAEPETADFIGSLIGVIRNR
jgi:hypothetical protein